MQDRIGAKIDDEEAKMKLLSEFKQFLLRGNFVEMAVALIMALAVFAVVQALIEDLITPLIAAIAGEPDFSALTFEINESTFRYGDFLNALITFVFIAAVVFFFIVVPMNALIARARREPSGPHDPQVPGMPKRDPPRCPPLRVLHCAGPARLTRPQCRFPLLRAGSRADPGGDRPPQHARDIRCDEEDADIATLGELSLR